MFYLCKKVIDLHFHLMYLPNQKSRSSQIEMGGNKMGAKIKFDWGMVDWSKQDVAISRVLGCSRERVRQKRMELGVGRSLEHHCRGGGIRKKILSFDTDGKTLDELAVEFGCSRGYVRNILIGGGKGYLRVDARCGGKYEWDRADWSLTDQEVALMLGVPNVGTVTQHRRRLGIVKKKFGAVASKVVVKHPVVGVGVKENV